MAKKNSTSVEESLRSKRFHQIREHLQVILATNDWEVITDSVHTIDKLLREFDEELGRNCEPLLSTVSEPSVHKVGSHLDLWPEPHRPTRV
jgi:hypothetical protein